jgi:type IV pilus assembly protein PilE
VSPNYDINPVADNTATPPTFTITATPKGNQAARDTACATLTVDQAGTKGATGTSGAAGCW